MNAPASSMMAILTRFAPPSGATSWDKKSYTLRAIISTGAPVVRHDYDGAYSEVLDLAGVELASRIPFLNSHRSYDLADIIGTVQKVERVGDALEAVIKLSRRADVDALAGDIADGIVGSISIGYRVFDWKITEDDDGSRTKTATQWQLLEVSAVAIPADDAAHIRGSTMTTATTTAPAAADAETTPATTATRAVPRLREDRVADELQLRGLASVAGLGDEWVREQLGAGVTLRTARAAAIDAAAERSNSNPTRSMIGAAAYSDGAMPGQRAAAMGEALYSRVAPDHQPSAAARQFMGLTLPEMARESLRAAGDSVHGLGPSQVIQRALERSGGMHSTSDFSVALSSAVGRVLRRAYDAAPSGLRPLARRMTMSDFRVRTSVSMSGFSALEKVNEHGEFKRGTISDGGENIKLETFGKIFAITRQALINDDLGAFADLPRKLGLAAAAFEAEQLAALLIANPLMDDGKAVFHVDHHNLGLADEPNATSLSAARIAMRAQTGASGQLLRIAPRHLVVGPELETSAEKLMATIAAPTTLDTQPIKLAIAVEPRITGKGWYVAADPAVVDGLTFAHLDSEPGPQLEHRVGFDVDGMEFKVRLDFGCAFLDHRGWYRNPGA